MAFVLKHIPFSCEVSLSEVLFVSWEGARQVEATKEGQNNLVRPPFELPRLGFDSAFPSNGKARIFLGWVSSFRCLLIQSPLSNCWFHQSSVGHMHDAKVKLPSYAGFP